MKKAFLYLLAAVALVLTACNSYPPEVEPDYELLAGDTTTSVQTTNLGEFPGLSIYIGQAKGQGDRVAEFIRSCGFEALHYAAPLVYVSGTTLQTVSINGRTTRLDATHGGMNAVGYLQSVVFKIRTENPHVKGFIFDIVPSYNGFVLWRTRVVLADFYNWRDITLQFRTVTNETVCYGLGRI